MHRHSRWPALLVCSTALLSCSTTHERCRRGTPTTVNGSLQCLLDGGADVVDVPPVMCGPDGGISTAADPLLDGIDQNCDRVDGVLSDTVFVSESGMDMPSAGASPDAPVRSLPFALSRARELGRSVILMQTGEYDSTSSAMGSVGTIVEVNRSVTIVGRFTGNQWVTRDATVAGGTDTVVRSPQAGVSVAADRVRLVGFSVAATLALAREGASVYGIFAVNSAHLELRDLRIQAGDAAPGTDGRGALAGAEGRRGEDAPNNGTAGRGGPSCAGTTNGGGEGGAAGVAGGADPAAGSEGQAPSPRMPAQGGPPGDSSDTRGRSGTPGTDGAPGIAGRNGGLGTYSETGFSPETGLAGSPGDSGTGGGGGGGAYSTMAVAGGGGGGGGGGGCGGEPGQGGMGGGGSFGVFLYGTTTATIVNCTITSGRGGNGGAGGPGNGVSVDGGVPEPARGGAGGAGALGRSPSADAGVVENRGGAGGSGGRGGVGGGGGPGLGGPSIGIVRAGGATMEIDPTTRGQINLGAVGTNGAGPISMPLTQRRQAEYVHMSGGIDAGAPSDAPVLDASVD